MNTEKWYKIKKKKEEENDIQEIIITYRKMRLHRGNNREYDPKESITYMLGNQAALILSYMYHILIHRFFSYRKYGTQTIYPN